jgi:hypothetical protein
VQTFAWFTSVLQINILCITVTTAIASSSSFSARRTHYAKTFVNSTLRKAPHTKRSLCRPRNKRVYPMALSTTLTHPVKRHSLLFGPTSFSIGNSTFCSNMYLFLCSVMIRAERKNHFRKYFRTVFCNGHAVCFLQSRNCNIKCHL